MNAETFNEEKPKDLHHFGIGVIVSDPEQAVHINENVIICLQ